jgi:hypothetical protein
VVETTSLIIFALLPGPPPESARGKQLYRCRLLRATRAWVRPYCYAWFRLTDDLKREQRHLLTLRPTRPAGDGDAAEGEG